MVKHALLFVGFTLALGGFSGCKEQPAFAQVVHTAPVKETHEVATEECEDVVVRRVRPVQDRHAVGGILAGGLLGGAIGNQFGSGNTRRIATVAGAAAGGYAGSQIQKGMQRGDTYASTRRKCKVVMKPVERVVGYDVKYLVDGTLASLRTDRDPGPMLPLEDGKPAVSHMVAQK